MSFCIRPWFASCRINWLSMLIVLTPITFWILLSRRHLANRVCISHRTNTGWVSSKLLSPKYKASVGICFIVFIVARWYNGSGVRISIASEITQAITKSGR